MVSQALRKIPALAAILTFALLLIPSIARAQGSRFLVVFPSTITSGEYAGDIDLFSALFADDATLAWTAEQPHAIATQRYREYAPVVASDPLGGAWLAYTIEHTDTAFGGDQDIVLRRIDRFGQNALADTASSLAVVADSKFIERNPKIVLSGASAIVAFDVIDRATGAHDIAAVRLDGAGRPIWTAPVRVASSGRVERLSSLVSDGRGGAIALIESESGADSTLSIDVYAVHIDGSGNVGWGATGEAAIVGASRHIERDPVAVADGFGGAYVAYEVEYTSGARAGDRDILAQHITAQGEREWISETALPFISTVANAAETSPVIALDSGGIVVAFEMDFHSERRPVRLVGVQRMDVTGKLTWNRGKKPETVMVPGRVVEHPLLVTDGAGGTYLVIEARDSVSGDIDVYAQKFASDGDQLWANGELPVAVFRTDTRERSISAQPDGSGGLVVAASKDFVSVDSLTSRKIVAQRIGADGRIAWPDLGGPLLLSNTTTNDDSPVVIRMD